MLTLGDIIRLNAKRAGKEVAIVWHDVRLTYAALDLRTNAIANALTDMGVVKGDRVALLASNCHQFIEVHVACAKIGAILVPLNNLLKPTEISRLLNHAEVKVIFITSEFAKLIGSIKHEIPELREFVSIGGGDGVKDYENLLLSYPTSDPGINVDVNEVAYIAYTSGTTGSAKGVMLTHNNIFSNAVNAAIGYQMPLGGIEVIPFPLFFTAVFNGHVIAHLFVGGRVVILDWFKPEPYIDTINKERPTFTLLNPTMLHDFVTHPRFKECDLSSLKLFVVTAAPISPSRFQEARNAIGNIFIQGYGLAECTACTTFTRPGDYCVEDPIQLESRLTSVGRSGSTLEVRVVDKNGKDVASNGEQIGELLVSGPSVMKGYWRQPEASAKAVENGWLHTGDLMTIDEDGYLWIVGRKKDMILSGGMNVYAEEVEDTIYTLTEVREAAVVGRPHERWGESVTAIIVLKSGEKLSEDTVIQHCKDKIATFKKPTKVIFAEQLPRNASGKILKSRLREQLINGELK
jgi:acyl-CoA synthetase (AMP-forming)/AMP-acid ligase II